MIYRVGDKVIGTRDMFAYSTSSGIPCIKIGEVYTVQRVYGGGQAGAEVYLDHCLSDKACRCLKNYWSDNGSYLQPYNELPITPEEAQRAISLPDPKDVFDFMVNRDS